MRIECISEGCINTILPTTAKRTGGYCRHDVIEVSDIIPIGAETGVELLLAIGCWWGNAGQKKRDVFLMRDAIRQRWACDFVGGWLSLRQ